MGVEFSKELHADWKTAEGLPRNASGSTAGVERNSFRSSAAGMSGGTSSPWSAGPTRLTLPPRRGSHNSAWGRATNGSAAPGLRSSNGPSPEGAKQGRCLVLCRPFRACQTRRLDSQGVALGWFVGAPSGRKNRAFLGRGASASRTLPLVMCNFRCGGLSLCRWRESMSQVSGFAGFASGVGRWRRRRRAIAVTPRTPEAPARIDRISLDRRWASTGSQRLSRTVLLS